ncbi:MAG: amidohydrolase family protein [Dehalococcoidia bacterium]
MGANKVVDVDGHIMEPSDLWEKNLEPQYRDRALRIAKEEEGLEYLEIDGKKSDVINGGTLGGFGGIGSTWEERRDIWFKSGAIDYEDARPAAARDPHARIKWMDERGIDVCLLYPSLGISWETECSDPKLAAAYCRVYNDWLVDFCKPYPDRLVPVAHISVMDVEEGVKEIKRAAKLGMKGVYLFSHPANGTPYGNRYYDSLWAEAQELVMPIGIHVSNTPKFWGHHLYSGGFAAGLWFFNMMYHGDCLLAFTSFFEEAVFERFPSLKVGVVEVGCGWIAHWLEFMDAKYKMVGFDTEMKHLPSEYFERQCFISGETDERAFAAMAQLVGAQKLSWGSDYPHVEGHADPLKELKETIGSLSQADQRKIVGENALKLYNLSQS